MIGGGNVAKLRASLTFFFSDARDMTYEEMFSTTHLPPAKRLAIAVLLDDPGAGNALADYLQEIGIAPDGLHVERQRVVGILEEAVAFYARQVEHTARNERHDWYVAALSTVRHVLQLVVDGSQPAKETTDADHQ